MLKSKKLLTLTIAAVASLGLASCGDDIISKPTNNDDPIITDHDNVVNNVMSVIYDAMRDSGAIKQEVLDTVLQTFANSYFGEFSEVKEIRDAGKDSVDFKEYVEKHDKFINTNVNESLSAADKLAFQFARLDTFVNEIDRRINETLFKELSSTAFEIDGVYHEYLFARSIFGKNYIVDGELNDTSAWVTDIITPTHDETDLDTLLTSYEVTYADYITRKITKDVYVARLTDQYVFDQNYPSLGRSAARKVNYVAIRRNPVVPEGANYLIKEFIDQNLKVDGADSDLEILASAWRGIDFVGNAEPLLVASKVFNKITTTLPDGVTTVDSYVGTAYGDLMTRFSKIHENPNLTDTSIESEFTNSNAYPTQHGLDLKTIQTQKIDYTTEGWAVRNGGLSELPSEIRNRVFNIGVANDFDRDDVSESRFLRELNGKRYLVPSRSEVDSEYDIIWYDGNTDTYFIVEIEEAVNATKLSREAANNYASIHDDNGIIMESIAREVANLIAKGTTGSEKSAQSFYLKSLDLQFHDQDVFDYFKTNWPELFEDE